MAKGPKAIARDQVSKLPRQPGGAAGEFDHQSYDNNGIIILGLDSDASSTESVVVLLDLRAAFDYKMQLQLLWKHDSISTKMSCIVRAKHLNMYHK